MGKNGKFKIECWKGGVFVLEMFFICCLCNILGKNGLWGCLEVLLFCILDRINDDNYSKMCL